MYKTNTHTQILSKTFIVNANANANAHALTFTRSLPLSFSRLMLYLISKKKTNKSAKQ